VVGLAYGPEYGVVVDLGSGLVGESSDVMSVIGATSVIRSYTDLLFLQFLFDLPPFALSSVGCGSAWALAMHPRSTRTRLLTRLSQVSGEVAGR
jgi:hypothetical protein